MENVLEPNRMRKFTTGFAFLLLLIFATYIKPALAVVDNVVCTNHYKSILSAKVRDLARSKEPKLRYPKNFEGVAGKNIMYGFESEYTMDQIDGIVKFYGPDPSLGISKQQWNAMPIAERSKWVREHLKELFPSEREAGKLVLLRNQKGYEFLPKALIKDSTGNIEFITGPFDSLEEWYNVATRINKAFGDGSMQAVLSTPREAFFDLSSKAATQASVKENEGYLSFFADYDTVEKLTVGHERWLKDPSKKVARSFEHPFLGPLTKQKQDLMETHLAGNAEGNLFDDATRKSVAGADDSYKYIGGTTYRPDIAGIKRPALEVRDAHNNFAMLYNKVARNTYYLQEGRAPFKVAKDLQAFDAVNSFKKFDPDVQATLKTLFPNKAKPGIDYSPSELQALDVFNNFSWPLRDWDGHIQFLGEPNLAKTIEAAQSKYKIELKAISNDLAANKITKEQAGVKVHGALVEFANESKIREAFKKKELALAKGNSRAPDDLVEESSISDGPFKNHFPEVVKTGPAVARMNEFAKLYPNNVKIEDNINFALDSTQSKRKVVVISTNGLNAEQTKQLKEDYLKYISSGTISFPLGENPGHLYSRFGKKSLDYYGWWNVNDYPLPNSDRLEAVVEFSPEEFLRARTYIDNVDKDRDGVLGSQSYNGVTGDTERRLGNNKPITEGQGHNCTSWICAAPIGKNDETLYELTGATRENEFHTNPGWWSNWLAAGAKQEKIPNLVYWTSTPLDQVKADKFPDGNFEWDFGRH
jgi:hypothetical protein